MKLPNSHIESVDVFIKLIKQVNALNDHVINWVFVELHLGSGVAVGQTKLRDSRTLVSET